MDLLSFPSCVCYAFVRVVWLFVPCGHLLGADLLTLGSRLLCITVSLFHLYPGPMWYLIVSIPDLCTLTYFKTLHNHCYHMALRLEVN